MGIGIVDWELVLAIGVGDSDWGFGMGMGDWGFGIGIGDWDWGSMIWIEIRIGYWD